MNGRPLEPSPKGGRASEGAVSVRLLGAFSVAIGGSPVPEGAFARKKARDLLKLLALDPGHNLHRDRAMDLLWPDLDPQAASAQLYKAVHQIRQGFTRVDPAAGDVLRFREGLLTLAAPGGIETDVATFERLAGEASRSPTPVLLARAVAAYAGDLLPSDLYEEWTLERRESLRERFLDLLGKLAESYADAGRLAEAADVFRQVLGRDPSREAAHRGLMHTYALLGSRDRAAHQYRVCARTLQTELGVEPSVETTALHREIVRGGIEPLRLVEQVSTSRSHRSWGGRGSSPAWSSSWTRSAPDPWGSSRWRARQGSARRGLPRRSCNSRTFAGTTPCTAARTSGRGSCPTRR